MKKKKKLDKLVPSPQLLLKMLKKNSNKKKIDKFLPLKS